MEFPSLGSMVLFGETLFLALHACVHWRVVRSDLPRTLTTGSGSKKELKPKEEAQAASVAGPGNGSCRPLAETVFEVRLGDTFRNRTAFDIFGCARRLKQAKRIRHDGPINWTRSRPLRKALRGEIQHEYNGHSKGRKQVSYHHQEHAYHPRRECDGAPRYHCGHHRNQEGPGQNAVSEPPRRAHGPLQPHLL